MMNKMLNSIVEGGFPDKTPLSTNTIFSSLVYPSAFSTTLDDQSIYELQIRRASLVGQPMCPSLTTHMLKIEGASIAVLKIEEVVNMLLERNWMALNLLAFVDLWKQTP